MRARTERRSVPSRRTTVAALCSWPFAASAQIQSSESFVRAIYEPYLKADFPGQPYAQADRFFAPQLASAMEADRRDAKNRNEVPRLNGDPFLDAQAWDIKNLVIVVKPDGQNATGDITFVNFGKPTSIALDLVQTPAGWRIADIRAPSGSLSALYSRP